MPISVAGILTAIIFAFTLVTQEFVYGVTFIAASSSYTVSVGVPTFLVRGDVYFWGSMMAACLIASMPIAIIYNFLRRSFRNGRYNGRDQETRETKYALRQRSHVSFWKIVLQKSGRP